MSQGIADDNRVFFGSSHLPFQSMAEIVPSTNLDADESRCRMQPTLAGVPQIHWLTRFVLHTFIEADIPNRQDGFDTKAVL